MTVQPMPISYISTGVSKEGREVSKPFLDGYPGSRTERARWFAPRRDASCELDDLSDECSTENWDGYGARPINPLAFVHARRFLMNLPLHVPEFEIAAHPDGEIAFEWLVSSDRILSVSVGKSGRLAYAAQYDGERLHGTAGVDDFREILNRIHALHVS